MIEGSGRLRKTLEKEADKILAATGLPTSEEVEKGELVPMNEDTETYIRRKSGVTLLDLLDQAQEESLKKYNTLPLSIKGEIIEYATSQRKAGKTDIEVLGEVKTLIEKAKEKITAFETMSSDDSDEEHKPKPAPEEIKVDKNIGEAVDDFLRKLQEAYDRSMREDSTRGPIPDFNEPFDPNKHTVN